jgi:long-chain acyl-CoA synthetase
MATVEPVETNAPVGLCRSGGAPGNVDWALQRALAQRPRCTAVIDGDVRFTYAHLGNRVGALCGGLAGLGIVPGDVVAVLSLNSHRHLECWLGIPRSGAVLNDLNFRLATAELAFIVEDSRSVALIVDDANLEVGRELRGRCKTLRHLIYAGGPDAPQDTVAYESLLAGAPVPAADLAESDLAGIFYTGGTTGLPKGAMLTHGNLLANAKHGLIGLGYREDDRFLHAAPMFHLADGGATYALTWLGATHVIVPAFEPELVARTIEEQRITMGVLVPTMINTLVNDPATAQHDLSSLRRIIYGASPMPADVQRRAIELAGCEWVQAYGMTEASPLVTVCDGVDQRAALAGEEPHATRLRSAGRPVVGVQAEVRREDGSRCQPGDPGEVWVRGPNVMVGYWNRPEETAAAFDAEGWYRSGDAAYADADGYIFIVDRVKDMIISGGENVYCAEVENTLHAHPDVLEAAVFGVPDPRWGEHVHAVIVPRPGCEPCEDALTEHCRLLIAGYKLPRSFEFYTEPLPKSGAGKILKRRLREPHWEGRQGRVA